MKANTFILLISILLWRPCLFAQSTSNELTYRGEASSDRLLPKPLFDSIIFGVEAGTIVGIAAITGFHHNFRQNLDFHNVSRGASYGLYAGILLGVYITYWADLGDDSSAVTVEDKSETSGAVSKLYYKKEVRKSNRARDFQIAPLFSDTKKVDGLLVSWTLLRF